ncbi:MAG TPA: glycerophosphodiester phosphodiesterase family protein [Humisphaera sp.]
MRTAALAAVLLTLMATAASHAAPAPAARPAVEFTAHRGESHDAPENTLAAFKLAWERGDAAVELDVHLTKDGKLIVSHDADTLRATGGEKGAAGTAGTKMVIKDHTADELRKLDVGSWKGKQFAGERLPLLDEALATIPPGDHRLFVEVKVGPEAVPELVKCVERAGKPAKQIVVIAFNHDTAAAAKKALPAHKVYWLAQQKQDKATKAWAPTGDELLAKAKAANADGIDISYKSPCVDAAFVAKAKAMGLEVYVWTVDDPAAAKALIEAGVNGVTTNRAAWLKEQVVGK